MKKTALLPFITMLLITPAMAVNHIITFPGSNLRYTPSTLSVTVGDTVTWQGSFTSHPLSSTTIPGGATAFSHNSGSSFSYTVTVAGTYNYRCDFHFSQGMVGQFTAAAANPCSGVNCDDADACTTDTCVNGNCNNTPIDCDDGNSATADSCAAGICTHTPVSGIQDRDTGAEGITAYPNPNGGKFTLNSSVMMNRVEVVNMLGKTVSIITTFQPQSVMEINLPEYSKGTYFVKIQAGDAFYIKKIVVE